MTDEQLTTSFLTFEDKALKWARAHMRCEMCRWYKDDPPAKEDESFGYYGDGWCGKAHIQWHDGMVDKAGGCIQDWEAK